MREQEDIPSGTILAAPEPISIERVREQCDELRELAELACTAAWSEACNAWWLDDGDHRLCEHSLGVLLLSDEELEGWLARPLDEHSLVDAHHHVTSMRAGVEREQVRRHLTGSALRTGAVWAEHRGGARTVFTAAEDVPKHVAQLGAIAAELPAHPFMRASWMLQAIGAVHPFDDANGGTSRFFASLELARVSLPPLVLTVAQRNKSYIDALMESNRTRTVDQIALVVHDAVQGSLASLLLAGDASRASWDVTSHARVDRWFALAERTCRASFGAPLEAACSHTDSPAGIARLGRRGYRLALEPAPRGTSMHLTVPLPINIDLVVSRLRGGPTSWLVAVLAGSIGERGVLAEVQGAEPITAMFVTPDNEPDDIVDTRFAHWLDRRVEQCMRGLSPWM